jgi:MatE
MMAETPPKQNIVLELAGYGVEESADDNDDYQDATDRRPLVDQTENGGADVISSMNSANPSISSCLKRLCIELKIQSTTALPALMSLVMSKIPWFISLRFLGNIGGEPLAAAALATTLHNVTGMSISVGMSFALSTLSGQAKGELISRGKHLVAKRRSNITDDNEQGKVEGLGQGDTQALNFRFDQSSPEHLASSTFDPNASPITPIVYLLRGMCVQLCLVIPVGIWWLIGIEDMLVYLGQGPQLARMASSYIQILTPSLWAYSVAFNVLSPNSWNG